MKTELDIVPHSIVPAEKIQVQQFELRNAHLHAALLTLTRSMSAFLEFDGGNTGAGIAQSEAGAVWADWERFKIEWQRALDNRALPSSGGHEEHYFVLIMTTNQILSFKNVRLQNILRAMRGLCTRVVTSDSAGQEYDVQITDEASINQHIVYVEGVLTDYAGSISGGAFTRGLEIPAHTHLGTVVPPESMGKADTYEPSPVPHAGPLPDVPDVPSTVPAPGSSAL